MFQNHLLIMTLGLPRMRSLLLSLLLSSLAPLAIAKPDAPADPVLKSQTLTPDFTQARAGNSCPEHRQSSWRGGSWALVMAVVASTSCD